MKKKLTIYNIAIAITIIILILAALILVDKIIKEREEKVPNIEVTEELDVNWQEDEKLTILQEIINQPLEKINPEFSDLAIDVVLPDTKEKCEVFLEGFGQFALMYMGADANDLPTNIYDLEVENSIHTDTNHMPKTEIDKLIDYTIIGEKSDDNYKIIFKSESDKLVLYEYQWNQEEEFFQCVDEVIGR